MFDLLYSPGMWIAVCLAATGLIFRCIKLAGISRIMTKQEISINVNISAKNESIEKQHTIFTRIYMNLRDSVVSQYPVLISITIMFHILVIVLPLCVKGHGVLFLHSWNFGLFSLSEATGDALTILVFVLLFVMVLRRMGLPYVRALTTWKDVVVLLVTSFPFITGFLAYHRIGNYEVVIVLHVLSGQILLVSLGWGKMGHMIFMLFSRFFVRSEYSIARASRVWGQETKGTLSESEY